MKKILFFLGSCIVIAGGIFYVGNTHYEIGAMMDQVNPLVPESVLYVKIPEPSSVDEHQGAYYKQEGLTKDGTKYYVEYRGMTTLKKGHFLKLTNKGKHIETYEEVAFSQLPEIIQEKI